MQLFTVGAYKDYIPYPLPFSLLIYWEGGLLSRSEASCLPLDVGRLIGKGGSAQILYYNTLLYIL